MKTRLAGFALMMLAAGGTVCAQAQKVDPAPTPPMGWNSWDAYGLTINEAQYRDTVDVMAAKLKAFGWQYAVIDEGWYLENVEESGTPAKLRFHRDAQGRFVPNLRRFPSSEGTDSFKPLADYVHARGLNFGIHLIRGIPKQTVADNVAIAGTSFHAQDAADTSDTCPWNTYSDGVKENAAGQAWYDSLMDQYAGWGVDYLKVDCISDHPYKGDEIRMIHRAILRAATRNHHPPMVLSLSPGPTRFEHAAEVAANAELWRISDDVWDRWQAPPGKDFPQGVKDQFARLEKWQPYAKAGNWPDGDMLPIGRLEPLPGYGKPRASLLTHDEQRTLLTLWSIARSPLIIGANLTLLDDWTLGLLTNREVLAVNQQGSGQKMALHDGDVVAWTSHGAAGQMYLAVFNLGDGEAAVNKPWAAYGLGAGKRRVRDLWAGKDMEATEGVERTVPAHACVLLRLE